MSDVSLFLLNWAFAAYPMRTSPFPWPWPAVA